MKKILFLLVMTISLSAFGRDATCLPDVVSEHYGMDDLKMEVITKRSICEKGGIIRSFDVKINDHKLSIPEKSYNDVLFSFRILFDVSYLSSVTSREGPAFVISTEVTHVLIANEWMRVMNGRWTLTCYKNGEKKIMLEYELNGVDNRIDLIARKPI